MFFNVNHEQMAAAANKLLAAKKAAAEKAKETSSKSKYEKGKLYFGIYGDGVVCIDSDPSLVTLIADNPNIAVNETGTRFHKNFGWVKYKMPRAGEPKKEAE